MLRFDRCKSWGILFFLVVYATNLNAQLRSVITHYSTADGLSNNRVWDIIKDKEGFMWMATWSGLNRFDGHDFLTYKTYPGDNSLLKNDRIEEIVDDKKGNIWTRAYDNQIYLFNKNAQEFIPLSKLLKLKDLEKFTFSKILHVSEADVWLATERQGVFRIRRSGDGKYHCTRFSKEMGNPNRLPSNTILFFHVDSKGYAWVSTSLGLSVLPKATVANGFSATVVNEFKGFTGSIIKETTGDFWIGTKEGYLFHVEPGINRVSKSKVSAAEITGILISEKKKLVFSTSSIGEIAFSSLSGSFIKKNVISSKGPLHSIYEDKMGLLWIEPALDGVIRYDPVKGSVKHFTQINNTNYRRHPKDYKVFEDINGVLWLAMRGCGFGYYNREADAVEYFYNHPDNPNKRLSNMVISLNYDPTGVLWLSTDAGGVDKIVFQSNDFKSFDVFSSRFKADNEVRGILTDHYNRLWVGTKSGRLSVFEKGQKINHIFSGAPENFDGIYSLLEDKKGRIWIGTKFNGLFKAEAIDENYTSYKFSHFRKSEAHVGLNTNTIYTLMEDNKGRIWAGSYGDGLILFQEKKGTLSFLSSKNSFKNYPKGNFAKIRCLQQDKFGNIWVGTTEGLLVFNPNKADPNNYNFKIYNKIAGDISSISGNDIQYILRSSKDEMWVCTSGGLSKATYTDPLKKITFENFSTKNGLSGDFILSSAEDNRGNLWLATENGISKFSPDKKKVQNFGLYDGLSLAVFSEGTTAKLKNGDIVFGSTEGLWIFSPDKIGMRKIDANLALINLQVNNFDVHPSDSSVLKQSLNNTKSVQLEYNQNTISIEFAVLDYRLDKKDSYVYRLLGFDDDWKTNYGQRRVTYTNLSPGKYKFEVKSQTEYLYHQVLQRNINIEILPPPWKTWWAYLIYFLLIAVSVAIALRVIFMFLKLKHRIAVERQVTNLKLSFFTQISHELRTPLTLIVNPAEEVLQSETLSERGKDYMNILLKNARRMISSVNQLLDLRKAQSGQSLLKISEQDIVAFSKDMVNYFTEMISKKDLAINFSADEDKIMVWFDAEKLDIVLYNLLANAIKFSDQNGTISISISRQSEEILAIEISDNGPGVTDQELQDIFKLYYEGVKNSNVTKGTGIGLALSKELVELHKGEIFAKHHIPRGLTVVVKLKLGEKHDEQQGVISHGDDDVEGRQSALISESIPDQMHKPLVVLVDDNEDLRHFLSDKLGEYYQVETAENGLKGLEKIKRLLPDLVLSDIMMPEMDGITLLNSIKNDITVSHIPVVLLTARFSVESEIESLRYGADYYITKPFKMELLRAAIYNLIHQRRQLFNALLGDKPVDEHSGYGAITEHDREFLEKIIAIVEERIADISFNIEDVAASMAISRSVFYKKFKSLTDMAPVEFVREIRLNKAKRLFDRGERNVSTVAYEVGFNNPKYFSTCFKVQFNETPSEYLKKLKLRS